MSSYLHPLVIDIGTIITYLGFLITIWLLILTSSIRLSFLRKARLPEVIKELEKASKKLSEHLKSKDPNKQLEQILVCKALIENIASKLPDQEKKKCKEFLSDVSPKNFYFFKATISVIQEDRAWVLYGRLSEITTTLIQLQKDSRWD